MAHGNDTLSLNAEATDDSCQGRDSRATLRELALEPGQGKPSARTRTTEHSRSPRSRSGAPPAHPGRALRLTVDGEVDHLAESGADAVVRLAQVLPLRRLLHVAEHQRAVVEDLDARAVHQLVVVALARGRGAAAAAAALLCGRRRGVSSEGGAGGGGGR